MQESINNQSMLKVGTILHGTYRIDSYLSSGGFGNTYVATNIEFEERVAIKEFFMKGVTQRDDNQTTVSVSNLENTNSFQEQKEKFKKEARRLRKLQNEHIVKVHDMFDENGTAYYVMDYVDGENLAERLKRTGRPMTESEVRLILPQILDALKAVHNEGFCHLDIKPSNIMLEKGGKIKLIDFGASKQLGANGTLTTNAPTAFAQTPGYAPREQMEQNLDKIGPWTDIYALGATLYNLLTNKRPPMPTDIDDDMSQDKHLSLPFPEGVSGLKFLVLQMMKTNRLQRPQKIDAIDVETKQEQSPTSESHYSQNNNWVESPWSTDAEGEETIMANLQPKKDEKDEKAKPEPRPTVNPKTTQNPQTYTPQENNNEESSGKGFIIFMIVAFFIVVIILAIRGCGNKVQEEIKNKPESTVPIVDVTPTSKNGYFEESYDDGSSYKGNFKDGLYHGQGTFTWANGDKYEGEFKEGARIKGTYTWPEKRKGYMYKYIGEFKNNEFEGKGTAYYVGGEIESGIWKNGKYMGSEEEQNLTSLERKVVGKHLLSIQWISWDYFGTCEITKSSKGTFRCVGSQYSKENSDYLKLDGYISIISADHLKFTGVIKTKIHHHNNGNEYVRQGTFDFVSTAGRKYWREQEMAGPDGVTDYIDIYFQKK